MKTPDKFVIHLQFWLVYITFFSFLISLEGHFPFSFYWVHFLFNLPALALFAYPVTYFFYPRIIKKQNPVLWIGVALCLAVVASFLKLYSTYHLFYGLYLPHELALTDWLTVSQVVKNLFWVGLPAGLLLIMRFYRDWLAFQKERTEMANHRLEAELQMLKSQLNPHFLFNVLNNLYALAIQKSEDTPRLIARLSDLFEFMLYQSSKNMVPLSDEVELIKTYSELQTMKYGDRLIFNINFEKGDANRMVAPLILFPFIENCFKHGCSNDPGQPRIDLDIIVRQDVIVFRVNNSKPSKSTNAEKKAGGIGIENTRKRLEILYPDKHELRITDLPDAYHVELVLFDTPIPETQLNPNVVIEALM
ncbi:MAG: histidine kinase [Marinilabiliaceae bacterium]|nr:histidine kinase [Marinilabiliaceae bacterium]